MRAVSKNLIHAMVLAAAICMTGCASVSSAWDSTTSSISDFFKSDKSDKPAEAQK